MLNAIDKEVNILKDVNADIYIGYLGVIENLEEIKKKNISNYKTWITCQKSQYLTLSLHFAKVHMNRHAIIKEFWNNSCKECVNSQEWY